MTYPEAIESAGRRPDRLSGNAALLPSELTTVSLGLLLAGRLYGPGSMTGVFVAEAVAIWILVVASAALAYRARPRDARAGLLSAPAICFSIRGLGLCALVVLARIQCPLLGWRRALAIGIMLGCALSAVRWLVRRAAGGAPLRLSDGWRAAGLQAIAAYALQPYAVGAQVGSGDAYSYSISLSDALEQLRHGVFPLFVGQTTYAFNGNIHPLRTAPLFEYLGGGLDFLTLHTLPIFGLQNLILVMVAVLAAVGCYAALRRYAPDRPWEAAGLASLYVLCPGVLVPLFGGDMVATFLTVPLIPWLVLGLAKAAEHPERWSPWLGQAAVLAALWWAHPPVAFWASLLALGAWLMIVIRAGLGWRIVLRIAATALVFAWLAAYVFESVHALDLRNTNMTPDVAVAALMRSISGNWRLSFMPILGGSFLGNIQLGYSLMAGALAGCVALRSRRSVTVLLAGMAVLFILLLPIPGVTVRLWGLAPESVLTVTNCWPMQRFYVILAGLAAFAAVAGVSRISPTRRWASATAGVCIGVGLWWSAAEAHKLIVGARAATNTRELSERTHRPENVALTRSSYEIFNFVPSYFSHGVMTPLLETRLIVARTLELAADGSTPVPGGEPARAVTVDLTQSEGATQLSPNLELAPGETSLLHFDFLGRQPEGVLQVTSPTLAREYILPSSGLEDSFGSSPTNSRVIAIDNDGDATESVTLFFYPRQSGHLPAGAFARVRVERLDAAERVIRLRSLLPFVVDVQSERPGILETPKVYVPGYSATVDGASVGVEQTGEGLVGVPVPAGHSRVRVDYPGGFWLRFSFWASATGWIFLAAGIIAAQRHGGLRASLGRGAALEEGLLGGMRRWGIPVLSVAAVALAGSWAWNRFISPPAGAARLVLTVPVATRPGDAEPLLTTGRTGTGDVIYLKYLGACQFVVGHEKWGVGATVSQPFTVDPTQPQNVDIAMKSLGIAGGVHVVWNGREVLAETSESYDRDPSTSVEVGANRIGATSCGTVFTGRILQSSRSPALPLPAAGPEKSTP